MAFSIPRTFPDYSTFHRGCDRCGRILSQVMDQHPRPCSVCGLTHYCGPDCFLIDYRTRHRPQCMENLDVEVDYEGAKTISAAIALRDLRKYTARWRDEIGDAAIDAMNLHFDPFAIDKQAFVLDLSYIPDQWRPMQRFRLNSARAQSLSTLTGSSFGAAKIQQEKYTVKNREQGMVGCALVILICSVPGSGPIVNSTFVGPELDLLVDPPRADWQERLLAAVRVNEPVVVN